MSAAPLHRNSSPMPEKGHAAKDQEVKGHRYEPRDVAPRDILYGAAALFGGLGASFVIVTLILWLVGPAREQRTESTLPPSPRLELTEPADRAAVEARANAKLQSYGWIDRDAGRVHIPIDRAMDLLAKQGWPDAATKGPPEQPTPAPPDRRGKTEVDGTP